jgi:hypothetical protein
MRMRLLGAAGLVAFSVVLAGSSLRVSAATAPGDEMRFDFTLSIGSTPIADYQDEFNTSAPAAGWSYLYNANGLLGNPANYVPLTASGGKYTAPSGTLTLGSSPSDVIGYPPMPPILSTFPNTFVRPGLGTLEDPAGIERAAIIAYTIQPNDIPAGTPAGPVPVAITAYDFAVSTLAMPDGMTARVYGGTNPTPLINFSYDTDPPFPFPPGFRFETTLDPTPKPLGTYNVGDTIYFAIGGALTTTVPEPAAVSLLAMPAVLLLKRRRA